MRTRCDVWGRAGTTGTPPAEHNTVHSSAPNAETRRSADPRQQHAMAGSGAVTDTFADRLNYLFATVRSPGQVRYSLSDVAAALRTSGVPLSVPYLSQLCHGHRTNPSPAVRAGLAAFFGVKPAYFTHDATYRRVRLEMAARAALDDDQIRDLTIQIAELRRPLDNSSPNTSYDCRARTNSARALRRTKHGRERTRWRWRDRAVMRSPVGLETDQLDVHRTVSTGAGTRSFTRCCAVRPRGRGPPSVRSRSPDAPSLHCGAVSNRADGGALVPRVVGDATSGLIQTHASPPPPPDPPRPPGRNVWHPRAAPRRHR